MVLDSFPTYIDVLTVTASRGSITKLSHSFVVTIGDIAPAERVTIIAVVKVNSTLTRTESVANTVTLTYGVSRSVTASVNYRVLYTTLPPTGDLPLNWRESQVKPGGVIPAAFVMVLGVLLLLIGIWSRVNQRKNTLWMIASGTILVLVGFFIGTSAMGLTLSGPSEQNVELLPTNDAGMAQQQSGNQPDENLPHLPASAFSTPEAIVPFATLPDYPIPTPILTQTPAPGDIGPDTSAIERIAIPAIFLDTIVKYVPYDGFSWMISGLREEVAWMGNTSWPGLGGNTALAGHVTVAGMGDGPFRHLDEIPSGEVVILYTEKNMYTYKVRENRITDDGDMSVISPTNDAQISLITCTDWDDASRSYLNRLVVIADLVRTEPITAGFVP